MANSSILILIKIFIILTQNIRHKESKVPVFPLISVITLNLCCLITNSPIYGMY